MRACNPVVPRQQWACSVFRCMAGEPNHTCNQAVEGERVWPVSGRRMSMGALCVHDFNQLRCGRAGCIADAVRIAGRASLKWSQAHGQANRKKVACGK